VTLILRSLAWDKRYEGWKVEAVGEVGIYISTITVQGIYNLLR
jgi:hypothetical protein